MSTVLSPLTRPIAVLLVEDNHDGADALAMFLRHCGYTVRPAYDGDRAIKAIGAHHYDAVICDIGLPRRNGYEVAQEVRRILGRRPLLIAVTAYDAPIVRQSARDAGFDYFLTKPADPYELDLLLQKHTEWLAEDT